MAHGVVEEVEEAEAVEWVADLVVEGVDQEVHLVDEMGTGNAKIQTVVITILAGVMLAIVVVLPSPTCLEEVILEDQVAEGEWPDVVSAVAEVEAAGVVEVVAAVQ